MSLSLGWANKLHFILMVISEIKSETQILHVAKKLLSLCSSSIILFITFFCKYFIFRNSTFFNAFRGAQNSETIYINSRLQIKCTPKVKKYSSRFFFIFWMNHGHFDHFLKIHHPFFQILINVVLRLFRTVE